MSWFKDLFGKKEEPQAYGADLTIKDLYEGCILDYFMKSWQVEEVAVYDWGNNKFSREYTLISHGEKKYLEVEENGDLYLSDEIKLSKLGSTIKQDIVDNETPPKSIFLDGKELVFDDEVLAHCYEGGDEENYSELVAWNYVDTEDSAKFVTIERWGEYDIEAFKGQSVEQYEFSNILPAHE